MADKKAAVKETAEKVAETVKADATAAKETVKKAAKAGTKAVKKTGAAAAKKTTTAAKKTVKKVADKAEAVKKEVVFVEFNDKQLDVEAIVASVKADFKANNKGVVRNVKVYIKPEDNAAYYVVNGKVDGKVDL
ncbi:MAG: hypothetical protein IKO44_01355 [Ruminococcus sp.]|nr:hypothetical protein [Ruminococcus sp.]